MFNRRRNIVLSVLLLTLLLAGGYGYFHISSQEAARHEAAANSPQYVYAVDPATNKVVTYSVLPEELKIAGAGFVIKYGLAAGVRKVAWDGCWYSSVHACPKPVAAVVIISNPVGALPQETSEATIKSLPRVIWHDGVGNFQQQFFKRGEVVYISDHPLPTDEDDMLKVVPQVTRTAS